MSSRGQPSSPTHPHEFFTRNVVLLLDARQEVEQKCQHLRGRRSRGTESREDPEWRQERLPLSIVLHRYFDCHHRGGVGVHKNQESRIKNKNKNKNKRERKKEKSNRRKRKKKEKEKVNRKKKGTKEPGPYKLNEPAGRSPPVNFSSSLYYSHLSAASNTKSSISRNTHTLHIKSSWTVLPKLGNFWRVLTKSHQTSWIENEWENWW